eukprot:18755-Eustigmatos_ZCMA.PRE.1
MSNTLHLPHLGLHHGWHKEVLDETMKHWDGFKDAEVCEWVEGGGREEGRFIAAMETLTTRLWPAYRQSQ